MTRIVIDLYDNVFWNKPIQKETDNGVLLSTKIKKDKTLKKILEILMLQLMRVMAANILEPLVQIIS